MNGVLPNYFETQNKVPKFIFQKILFNLEPIDLARCSKVNKSWNQLAKDQLLRVLGAFTDCCKENNIEFGGDHFFSHLIYGEDQMLERIKSCFSAILPNKMKVFECRFLFHSHHYITVQGSNNSPPPYLCKTTKEFCFFLKKLKDDSLILNYYDGKISFEMLNFRGYYITFYCLPDKTDTSELLYKKIEEIVGFLQSD